MLRVRVVLADDHALVRAGIRSLLERLSDVDVVAETASGAECVQLVKVHLPDLVLVDIAMPGLSGLEVAKLLQGEVPTARVIILSMHATESYVRAALDARVAGYLLKDAAPVELDLAIRAVMRGEIYLSPAVSTLVVGSRSGHRAPQPQDLSPRQLQVLRLLAAGKTTKEIAFELGVSVKTVETHRALLMQRLGIHDVAGLVKYAIRVGLIKADR